MSDRGQSEALARLALDIQRLQIECTRSLAGDREHPPQELRDELEARVRNLRASPHPTTAERFRLNSLAAKLASQTDLFDRRSRQGRAHSLKTRRPSEAIVVGSQRGERAVNQLYHQLYRLQQSQDTDLTSFRTFLERKVDEIRQRTGCSSVLFRVVERDSRPTLKAQPIGRTGGPAANRHQGGSS